MKSRPSSKMTSTITSGRPVIARQPTPRAAPAAARHTERGGGLLLVTEVGETSTPSSRSGLISAASAVRAGLVVGRLAETQVAEGRAALAGIRAGDAALVETGRPRGRPRSRAGGSRSRPEPPGRARRGAGAGSRRGPAAPDPQRPEPLAEPLGHAAELVHAFDAPEGRQPPARRHAEAEARGPARPSGRTGPPPAPGRTCC